MRRKAFGNILVLRNSSAIQETASASWRRGQLIRFQHMHVPLASSPNSFTGNSQPLTYIDSCERNPVFYLTPSKMVPRKEYMAIEEYTHRSEATTNQHCTLAPSLFSQYIESSLISYCQASVINHHSIPFPFHHPHSFVHHLSFQSY